MKFNTLVKAAFAPALMGILLSSCKTHEHETTPEVTTGTLSLHLHTMVDTNEVESYGEEYTLTGGRKTKVDMAQLYISDLEAIKLDGSVYAMPDQIVLKRQQEEVIKIGNIPVGNYKTIRFKVGLNDTKNTLVPVPADSALNHPEMWFAAAVQPDGYVYLNFQGSIDTTTAANGSTLIPFAYKIGTTQRLQTVQMPDQEFSVSKGASQFIHMKIDYAKLFTGFKLNNSSNLRIASKPDNDWPIAGTISANIQSIFEYED